VSLRNAAHVVGAVVRRPSLWPIAVGQWRRTVPPGWWRRRPFLPVPTAPYVRFRLTSQYGTASQYGTTNPDAPAMSMARTPDDIVDYLRWCRQQRRLPRR
jgi:hypothetical protein